MKVIVILGDDESAAQAAVRKSLESIEPSDGSDFQILSAFPDNFSPSAPDARVGKRPISTPGLRCWQM